MFLVSEKLPEIHNCPVYTVSNEMEIETLSLLKSRIGKSACSFLDDEKYLSDISPDIKMIITTEKIASYIKKNGVGVVETAHPRALFFLLHNSLKDDESYSREQYSSIISDSATISSKAVISKKNVTIEDGVIIEPFVSIYPNVTIRKNSIIRSGTRLGGPGFEYKRYDGGILTVEHLGGVCLGENVEIKNNTTIDCAVYPWDNTVVDDNTKIDNLVYIAHGCKIGKNCLIVANSAVGGRTVIKNNVWVGLGAVIRNGIVIGEGGRVNMGAVVTLDVAKDESVTGNFATEHNIFIKKLKENPD